MNRQGEVLRGKKQPKSVHTKRSAQPLSEVSETDKPAHQVSEGSDAANKYKQPLRSYRFQRGRTPGIIEVLNEHAYVMAEYSERTGSVKWQRIVLATQREQIEKWLGDHYPRA